MNRFLRIVFMFFIFSMGLFLSPAVKADNSSLTSKPSKCVSLKQGTVCYQSVLLEWNTDHKADYCLYNEAQAEALKCWHQLNYGTYKFEFSYPQTQQYVLRLKGGNESLASTLIEVKWVYKSRRNNRFNWRVF